MMSLRDGAERERFATELNRNFSVLASAGSGKTYAITERVLAIASDSRAVEWLPQLVVVTFTNRAADEMQQRSRQRLLESGATFEVIAAFDRAFFGTIHSFCVKLLRAHGHALGLPSKSDLINDDGPLWRAFLQQHTRIGRSLSECVRKRLFRHVRVGDVLELGRRCAHELRVDAPSDTCDELDCESLLAFRPTRANSLINIERSQRAVQEWLRVVKYTDDFAPLPEVFGESKQFLAEWSATFQPLREWLQRAALCVACETARSFREFRLKHGTLTYDDQVALARELLRDPEIARRIREKNYRVILDEAQDTDPEQFALLTEVARAPDAEGEWPGTGTPPRSGHFSMVGDFQQSIYGSRADLQRYRRVHHALVNGEGEELIFSVTFRLDECPLRLVNAVFPHLLTGTSGQVDFVPLAPRPTVLGGQVLRLDIPFIDSDRESERAWHEAKIVAGWIRDTGLDKLRAQRWSDVAIICPRKGWFRALRSALRSVGIAAQLQSDKEIRGDHPAVAWFTGLIVSLAEPENAFEIVGVLREVFGLSDHALAEFSEAKADRFTLLIPPETPGSVGETLRLLATLRARLEGKALLAQVHEVVAATRLRDRLLSLPPEEYEGMDEELDGLLTRVAAAEADGLTLFGLAERLRTEFGAAREAQPVEADSLQVITAHKAKGSEWPVVVLPFFARAVITATAQYPIMYRDAQGEAGVAFSKHELSQESKDARELRERQELERLLYVTMTRAKHTLVVVDDRDLFATQKGLRKAAQANLLKLGSDGINAPTFTALTTEAQSCAETMRQRQDTERRKEAVGTRCLPSVNGQVLAMARERATHFVKRNPSALAHAAPADPTKAPDREALAMSADPVANRYGVWWHSLMEKLDWSEPGAWQPVFDAALPLSPDPTRAQIEWPLFVEKIGGRIELIGGDLIYHAEMPFLWRTSDRDCIEGIADLVVYDRAAKRWLVVDWKTNAIYPRDLPALREMYQGQLAAYRAAFEAMLGGKVSAALYSTATGEWLPYEVAALDETWREIGGSAEKIEAAMLA